MNSAFEQYWHELYNQMGLFPVWLPGTPMRLGDVGTLDDKGWVRVTSLAELGVIPIIEEAGVPQDYVYASSSGVTISSSLGAGLDAGIGDLARGRGRLKISFSREAAVVVMVNAMVNRVVRNIGDIDGAMVSLYREGLWGRGWTCVTQLAVGGPSLVLMAAGAGAQATVKFGVSMSAAGSPLGKVESQIKIASGKDLGISFASDQPCPLMWQGRFVDAPKWRKTAQVAQRGKQEERDFIAEAVTVREIEYPSDAQGASDTNP